MTVIPTPLRSGGSTSEISTSSCFKGMGAKFEACKVD
jgi:hypothetical protein